MKIIFYSIFILKKIKLKGLDRAFHLMTRSMLRHSRLSSTSADVLYFSLAIALRDTCAQLVRSAELLSPLDAPLRPLLDRSFDNDKVELKFVSLAQPLRIEARHCEHLEKVIERTNMLERDC